MITQYGFDLYWSQQKAPYEFVNRPSDVSKDLTITGLPCGDDRSCQCDDRYSDSMVRSLLLEFCICILKAVLLIKNSQVTRNRY